MNPGENRQSQENASFVAPKPDSWEDTKAKLSALDASEAKLAESKAQETQSAAAPRPDSGGFNAMDARAQQMQEAQKPQGFLKMDAKALEVQAFAAQAPKNEAPGVKRSEGGFSAFGPAPAAAEAPAAGSDVTAAATESPAPVDRFAAATQAGEAAVAKAEDRETTAAAAAEGDRFAAAKQEGDAAVARADKPKGEFSPLVPEPAVTPAESYDPTKTESLAEIGAQTIGEMLKRISAAREGATPIMSKLKNGAGRLVELVGKGINIGAALTTERGREVFGKKVEDLMERADQRLAAEELKLRGELSRRKDAVLDAAGRKIEGIEASLQRKSQPIKDAALNIGLRLLGEGVRAVNNVDIAVKTTKNEINSGITWSKEKKVQAANLGPRLVDFFNRQVAGGINSIEGVKLAIATKARNFAEGVATSTAGSIETRTQNTEDKTKKLNESIGEQMAPIEARKEELAQEADALRKRSKKINGASRRLRVVAASSGGGGAELAAAA